MEKAIMSLVVSALVGFPLCARAAEADAGIELAFMPSTMDVTLLNERRQIRSDRHEEDCKRRKV